MKQWLIGLVAVIIVVVTTTSCQPATDTKNVKAAATTAPASTSTSSTPDYTYTPPPAPPKPTHDRLTKNDLNLVVRITSKQCFGTAGCNVEYKISVGWNGPAPDLGADYDVTYRVTGDDSGPIIDTLTVYRNGKYTEPYEGFMSTSNEAIKPSAFVTSVHRI